ncbi:MAG: GGDEF domain-containing protein [Marinagarivorans sp.]
MALQAVPFSAVRILVGLLTCAAIFLQHLIPPKVLTLRPNAALVSNLYGHQHSGGQPSAYWVDETQQHFHCDYSPTDPYSCGYTIAFGADPTLGIDLTGYEALQLKIRYQGEAPRIRIFMRNYNPHFDRSPDPGISSKFMSVSIRAADLHEPVLVKMNEFSVGEWWIRDFDVPRIHSAPEFTNVTSLGIDFIFHGSNEVRVESVALVGARIKKETFYLAIIVVWILLVAWEGFCKIYYMYRNSQSASQRIDRLLHDYKNLEIEKQEFVALSTTDILTGILNRAGVQQFWAKLFRAESAYSPLGVLLLDVDYFKSVNDTYGHDAGDHVLKAVATLIASNTRQSDILGRWGGEEFILICPQLPAEHLLSFAEDIRSRVRDHVFESPHAPLHLSISIGATLAQANESFESVLKRADLALYEAKYAGRDRVVFK